MLSIIHDIGLRNARDALGNKQQPTRGPTSWLGQQRKNVRTLCGAQSVRTHGPVHSLVKRYADDLEALRHLDGHLVSSTLRMDTFMHIPATPLAYTHTHTTYMHIHIRRCALVVHARIVGSSKGTKISFHRASQPRIGMNDKQIQHMDALSGTAPEMMVHVVKVLSGLPV